MTFAELLDAISGIVWGPGMIILLVGTGLYLTVRLRFVQIRRFGHAVRCITGKYDRPEEAGDISHFQALAAALSATIGVGNIAGVATAIALGGPGAIFWMWTTALVGMATKFTSCSLALRFREVHEDGSASGGPMYFLEKGFRPNWLMRLGGQERTQRWATALGFSFALFAMIASFGIGNMVQAHSVVNGLNYLIPEQHQKAAAVWIGVVLAFMVGVVIIGGIRRIAQVASKIVPIMSVVYIAGAIAVLLMNLDRIGPSLAAIFRYAFEPFAVGGGFFGAVVAQTIRYGVARGVFSNESGLGSAPMAHAAAKTGEMAREGFVAMLGPFIDTIVICTMTALVILSTGAWQVRDDAGRVIYGIGAPYRAATVDGVLVVVDEAGKPLLDAAGKPYKVPTSTSLTAQAFETGLARIGPIGLYIVVFGLVFFAYSTMISWSYYGDRCAEFLLGPKAIMPYRCLYVVLIVVGACWTLKPVWTFADIFNALMAIPNLIGLLALSGLVARETRSYLRRLDAGEF